ncbi:hypothetical protein C8R47DRAFT_40987, partial [Mycena vitilis]
PILEVRNIQRLRPSIRRVALAACIENPSFTTLRRVEQLSSDASDSQKPHFVPVFFLSLDPILIPTSDELESPSSDTWNRVACAATSLHAILSLIVAIKYPEAEEVGEYLWPRVWSWLHFIDGHKEHLPSPSPYPRPPTSGFSYLRPASLGQLTPPPFVRPPGSRPSSAKRGWPGLHPQKQSRFRRSSPSSETRGLSSVPWISRTHPSLRRLSTVPEERSMTWLALAP